MKKVLAIASFLVVLGSIACNAQTILINTTLAAALTTSSGQVLTVTSATNISAPQTTDPTKFTYLYIDREMLGVTAVNGTQIGVSRGLAGTIAASHYNAATVFVVPAYAAIYFELPPPHGSCTRGQGLAAYLPVISPTLGIFSDCVGGGWINSGEYWQVSRPQPNGLRFPDPGATALTALETSGTAMASATSIYCSEIDVSSPQLATGLGLLNGTTVGTNNHWVLLYDSTGNLLANSATAGALSAGASTYQKFAFTSKYLLLGPARYFACAGDNGTTDTVRHSITAVNDNILAGAVTTQVFGTAAATITVPTTYTTATGPYFLIY